MKHYLTGEIAQLAGVSERTIRYYDKIGLLKPSMVLPNGYRAYSDEDLLALQRILLFKELDFSLEDIRSLVHNEVSLVDSFASQKALITTQIEKLQQLVQALDDAMLVAKHNQLTSQQVIELLKAHNEQLSLVSQYKDDLNLKARISLHEHYSTNSEGWFGWLARHIELKGVNRLLELGCGNGVLWENFQTSFRNREIFLTDKSVGMVNQVRKRFGNRFNYVVMNMEDISFQDNYFDVVIANHVLFYATDIHKTIQQIKRVLKPGGKLYASTYGVHHMAEISQLVTGFDSSITLSKKPLFEVFGLENGKDLLSTYFSDVRCIDYPDQLVIDEVKPLLNYIMSCHGNQIEKLTHSIGLFESYLRESLPIHITKEAGLFVCEK